MGKNLMPKAILIIILVLLAAWTLYPPDKTLKPGIDLAGGTSLIYEIDTQDLANAEQKDLAQRMITVLRRRIDPANIQNLIWRPQGNTRFEIQMPLASAEARQKRQNFETAKEELLAKDVNRVRIIRSLKEPIEQRNTDFNDIAQGNPNRLTILESLAEIHDELKELRDKRDKIDAELKAVAEKISSAGLDLDKIEQNRSNWSKLNKQQLQKTLTEFIGDANNLDLLTTYIDAYIRWAEVANQLPEKNTLYEETERKLDKLNLTEEQLDLILEMSPKSAERKQQIEKLKADFPDRAQTIDQVVAAFDEYRPFRGRLDDPSDLQRMLKGAGILEFRILPTVDNLEQSGLTIGEAEDYAKSLTEKGPKYASDNKFAWFEIENIEEWKVPSNIIAPFGTKYYVLASNRPNETMLHQAGDKDWKLVKAAPGQDEYGRNSIDFVLDERGGRLFGNITGKNIDRPLCILLDNIAISAPKINSKITTRGQITGDFAQTEVVDMVNKLNAGSLPARLIEQPISEKTIGPSIGADNRDKGIIAGFIGLFVVIFCMLIYYLTAGSIADAALLMNILFVLAIMAGIRATFTLPGIAGIILTIGMSVDANVLIFERIREEQQKGLSLTTAVRNGYQRAFRAIVDANITTFITAAILYWRASEEIRGFAIVLMLGILSSMFTALFVTRFIFDFLLTKRIIRDRLAMLRLIHEPKVNWMGARPIFFCISAVLISAGLLIFFTRDNTKNNKYDIEFTGGTSIIIELKDGVNLTRQDVEDRIHKAGTDLSSPGLAVANVYRVGKPIKSKSDGEKTYKQYEINTTETNRTTAMVIFAKSEPPAQHTVETITAAIRKAEAKARSKLNNLQVTQRIESPPAADSFIIATSQVNPSLVRDILNTAFPQANISEPQVDEIVNHAVKTAFKGELKIRQNLQPEITSKEKITDELIDSYPEIADFLGGIKIECTIERAASLQEIHQRFKNLRMKSDIYNFNWYTYDIFNQDLDVLEPNEPVQSFVYVSTEPEAGFRELSEDEWTGFVENETDKVLTAVSLESFFMPTQFDPSVGAEQKQQALIAIILSLFAIVTYIWIRFGNVRYGLAAILALVHDVCITLGAVTVCTYIAATPIGEKLLIGDFKINLAIIAAFLTLIGYSLNDTIVVFDRIRENRRKARLNPKIITDSINQTISRTIMTSFTTFIVVLIMYIFGGQGLRGFTFAIGFGIIIGTYSSIAIASPILLLGTKTKKQKGK